MTLTPLSTLLAQRRRIDDSTRGFDVPEDWLQGRTSFGGLVSVLAVNAMREVAAGAWPQDVGLRALQTNFIAPVEGGPVEVVVQVLREGRNVRQVQSRLMQRGEVCALAVGVFGSARDSRLPPFAPQRPPPARAPEDIPAVPFVAGTRPHFTAHFDMRWSGGAPPFRGVEGTRDASIHVRLIDDDAKGLSPELMTVMMADVSPTPVLSQFDRPTPASSVSWALELRPLPDGEPLDGWWRADNLAVAAAGGYVNQQSMLWSPSGTLAGLAYQVVTVYG
jgi:acyl-CoA thioesterase